MKSPIVNLIQVSIPFSMLRESYLEKFLSNGLNPEIGLDAVALDSYKTGDYRLVAEKIQAAGLSVTLHGPFMDLSAGSPDPKIRALTRERFEQLLETVPIFRPTAVVCHAGYESRRYLPLKHEWLNRSLEFWGRFARELLEMSSVLMLENVFESDPEEIRVLLEGLDGSGTGFCLDMGHQAAFSRVSLYRWLDVLGPFMGELHLHDNRGYRDEHLGLGQGRVDFEGLFTYLARRKQEEMPIVTLETHREEDLMPSLDYLEKRWPW